MMTSSPTMEVDTVLTLLECPVCLLPPRVPPIYQCRTGHLVCAECQPSLNRCPICDIKYRSCLTRDFFAEKLLEHLDRRCRYQHFGCDASYKDSQELVEHEAACEHKPAQPPVKRKKKREEAVDGNVGADDQEEEEESDVDEDDDEEEEIEIEDVFLSNFAFILVLLRAYVLEFVDYDEDRVIPDNLNFEYLLVFLLCAWLYHSWQENGFHLMLDETSPFMAAWFMSLVLMVMMLKAYFSPWTSPDRMTAYLVLVAQLKPALTLLTGVFSCSVHCFVHDLWREENVFVLSCVLAVSLALSSIEIFWSLQCFLPPPRDQERQSASQAVRDSDLRSEGVHSKI